MIELLPSHIDGNKIFADEENKLETIDLRDCDYMNAMSRTVSIENKTKNKVEFEWVFDNPKGEKTKITDYDPETMTSRDEDFRIDPKEGFFQGKEVKTFTIKFSAQKLIPCYDKIHLTIRNIPLESVKNPPSHILDRINQLKEEKKDPFNDSIISEKKIEFIYYTWQLIGDVSAINYTIDPPLLIIPYLQPIGKLHKATFVLHNWSESASDFKMFLEYKNNDF